MKKQACFLIAVILVTLCLALAGCGSDTQKSYANKPSDGHMHSYVHNIRNNEYVCQLCGVVYAGDPSDLIRVD